MSREAPLHSQRVLVVEDQYYLATDICEWLEGAGATVVGPVGNAAKAFAMLDEGVDTAVVDINLGVGPTFDVAQALSERGVPFLFATGYDAATIPSQFESAPRLEKPFNGSQLVDAVLCLGAAEAR
jgi:CheY-like chemotaxis protein